MKNHPEQVVGICGLFCKTCPTFADGLCEGCLSDHVAKACTICQHGFRDCAKEHHVTWCFECSDFPCKRLRDFKDCHVVNGISHHEHILEYVQRQKKIGIKAWVGEQEKANACPDCGNLIIWCEKTCRFCGSKAFWNLYTVN